MTGPPSHADEELLTDWRADRAPRPRAVERLRSTLVRLHASPGPRRLVPARLAFAAIDLLAVVSRRAATRQYRQTLAFQRRLLAHTPRADDAEAVAQASVAEVWKVLEIFFRPWLMARSDAVALHHLRDAQASGRGVLIAFPHYGQPYAMFPVLHRHGISAHYVAGPHHYGELGSDWDGRFSRRGRTYIELLGPGRGIPRPGTFATALKLLRRGETVGVAFDMEGSLDTPFLGRMLRLASGPSELASQADALVVPLVARRQGTRPVIVFARAIDPREHDGAAGLQRALATVMERWTLEAPETVWAVPGQTGGPPLVNGPALAARADTTTGA